MDILGVYTGLGKFRNIGFPEEKVPEYAVAIGKISKNIVPLPLHPLNTTPCGSEDSAGYCCWLGKVESIVKS